MSTDIAIVGGGIGGLTLALKLEQLGLDFQLYEQAPSFEALGYGIQVSPNVVRVLQSLGIESSLAAIAHRCTGFELRDFNQDQGIARWSLDSAVPYYHCRRADLHQILYDALQQKDRIHFSHRLTAFEEKSGEICATFNHQDTGTSSVLVAADGVHSFVRRSLHPSTPAAYGGYAAYRAILPFQDHYHSFFGKATVWMGVNHHVVVYPTGNHEQGSPWLNLVLVKKDTQWHGDSWTIPANKTDILQEFANQSAPLTRLLEDLQQSPAPCYQWGLFNHAPLPYWSQQRVTLLGDAAHPLLPFQAQGAAMAIEDAACLAQQLARAADYATALQNYQRARMPRTQAVQAVSRQNAEIFHADGVKAWLRNAALGTLSAIAPPLLNLKTAWIYDYDVASTGR